MDLRAHVEGQAFWTRYVSLRIDRVSCVLSLLEASDGGAFEEARRALQRVDAELALVASAAERAGVELADARLARVHGLEAMELEVLWLSVAPYLEPNIQAHIAAVHGLPTLDHVDVALCVRALSEDPAERMSLQRLLQPASRLFKRRLLRLEARSSATRVWTRHALVPAEHVVSFFAGVTLLSAASQEVARRVMPSVTLDDLEVPEAMGSLVRLVRRFHSLPALDEAWLSEGGMAFDQGLAVLLYGSAGSGRTLLARALAGSLGSGVVVVDGHALAVLDPREASDHVARVIDEALVWGDLVVIRDADRCLRDEHPVAVMLGRRLVEDRVVVVVCAEDADVGGTLLRRVISMRIEVRVGSAPERQLALWKSNLPEAIWMRDPESVERLLSTLAGRYTLSPLQIRKASQLALLDFDERMTGGALASLIDRAARAQLVSSPSALTHRHETHSGLDDLILPEASMNEIKKIIAAYNNRSKVLNDWGLGQRITRGTGILCLFNGDPGTGKTFSAEVIAQALSLELTRVNVSTIVDKYVGETEKNLTRIFEQADPNLHLLLFDEADSLFSKRTSVKSSNDRYANMEINVLLQLIEDFRGIAVLTTNLKSGIDNAFSRRISFKVDFPLPGIEERERIWASLIPSALLEACDLDLELLAEDIELAGGSIKNAVLRAAYAAAAEGRMLTTEDLFEAAEREAAAEGRLVRARL